MLLNAMGAAGLAGYTTGATNCDVGAAEAIGLPEGGSVFTVSIYYRSEHDAQAAADSFHSRGTAATAALVQTFCVD